MKGKREITSQIFVYWIIPYKFASDSNNLVVFTVLLLIYFYSIVMKKLLYTFLGLVGMLSTAKADYQFTFSSLTDNTACITKISGSGNGKLVIPETTTISGKSYTITKIEGTALNDNEYKGEITEISLPNTINALGGSTFAYCTGLTKINIPTSLEALAGYLFKHCTSLKRIDLPATLARINSAAFYGCYNLEMVAVYNPSVIELKDSDIFYDCSKMKVYVLPSAYTAYTDDDKWSVYNISSMYVVNGLNSATNGTVTADKETYLPGETATFTIAPDGNYKIKSVTINGTNYTSSVSNGEVSYSNIKSDITISVTFEEDSKFIFTVIDENNVSVKAKSTSISGSITIPSKATISGKEYNVTEIASDGFRNCSHVTAVVIPSSVTKINGSAFRNCINLASISIPSSVTAIGGNGFDGCASLTTIVLPDNLVALAGYLFNGCTELENVTLPANLDRINEYAFSGCSSLKSIVLPVKFTKINNNVFDGCTSLVNVTCKATTTPAIVETSFTETQYKNATLHVPASALSAYTSHAIWGKFMKSDTATPIKNITADEQQSGKRYNLQGQEVGERYRGIVIKNSRKYIQR